SGSTAWAVKNWCLMLTATLASQNSGVVSSTAWRLSLAALFSSTVKGPVRSRSAVMAARRDSTLVRSAAMNCGAWRDVAARRAARSEERGRVAGGGGEGRGQRRALVGGQVDEADLGALFGKGLDQRLADAGGPAGDEDGAVLQAGIAGECTHELVSGRRRLGG